MERIDWNKAPQWADRMMLEDGITHEMLRTKK